MLKFADAAFDSGVRVRLRQSVLVPFADRVFCHRRRGGLFQVGANKLIEIVEAAAYLCGRCFIIGLEANQRHAQRHEWLLDVVGGRRQARAARLGDGNRLLVVFLRLLQRLADGKLLTRRLDFALQSLVMCPAHGLNMQEDGK